MQGPKKNICPFYVFDDYWTSHFIQAEQYKNYISKVEFTV